MSKIISAVPGIKIGNRRFIYIRRRAFKLGAKFERNLSARPSSFRITFYCTIFAIDYEFIGPLPKRIR